MRGKTKQHDFSHTSGTKYIMLHIIFARHYVIDLCCACGIWIRGLNNQNRRKTRSDFNVNLMSSYIDCDMTYNDYSRMKNKLKIAL